MHGRSWSTEKAWIFKAFNTNVESLRKERTLGLKPCVSASLQEKKKKKSFEWLSESWELQRERHWLMQQKSWRIKLGMSVLRAGNAVVFSAYLIWVLLEQQHRKRWENTTVRMVCICQKAPRACYCRVSDNNCIQNVHSKTVNYLKCICNDKSAHKNVRQLAVFFQHNGFWVATYAVIVSFLHRIHSGSAVVLLDFGLSLSFMSKHTRRFSDLNWKSWGPSGFDFE